MFVPSWAKFEKMKMAHSSVMTWRWQYGAATIVSGFSLSAFGDSIRGDAIGRRQHVFSI